MVGGERDHGAVEPDDAIDGVEQQADLAIEAEHDVDQLGAFGAVVVADAVDARERDAEQVDGVVVAQLAALEDRDRPARRSSRRSRANRRRRRRSPCRARASPRRTSAERRAGSRRDRPVASRAHASSASTSIGCQSRPKNRSAFRRSGARPKRRRVGLREPAGAAEAPGLLFDPERAVAFRAGEQVRRAVLLGDAVDLRRRRSGLERVAERAAPELPGRRAVHRVVVGVHLLAALRIDPGVRDDAVVARIGAGDERRVAGRGPRHAVLVERLREAGRAVEQALEPVAEDRAIALDVVGPSLVDDEEEDERGGCRCRRLGGGPGAGPRQEGSSRDEQRAADSGASAFLPFRGSKLAPSTSARRAAARRSRGGPRSAPRRRARRDGRSPCCRSRVPTGRRW